MASDVTAQRYSAGGPRIAGLLSIATEQAMAAINGEVSSRHPALGLAHLQIFRFGSIEGRRVTELATLMRMTKQSMHELVGHLERHGYLRREPDPTDARARIIRMTELGVQLERQMVGASARLHLAWYEQIGSDCFVHLWSALQQITGRRDPQPALADLRRRADLGVIPGSPRGPR
ncbi:MAG: MarR family winged helix-turn-helix transcriptional regulator [Pseudonocardiaceae bacterium]